MVQETLESEDFAHIPIFDGDLGRFPDWADRVGADLVRTHPKLAAILEWAERQGSVITEQVEQASMEPGANVTYVLQYVLRHLHGAHRPALV